MGYNTIVVVYNDHLGSIEKDPEFGKKLASAILDGGVGSHEPILVRSGGAVVVETHHADHETYVAVGGNTGRVVTTKVHTLETIASIAREISGSEELTPGDLRQLRKALKQLDEAV